MANPVTWFEIIGKDAAKLQRFYKDTFDWKVGEPSGPEMGHYAMVDNEGQGIGGGIGGAMDGQSRTTIYVQVDDPQAYLDRVNANGGKTVMPVTTIPGVNVTLAMFSDPEGNVVGLLKTM